MQNYHQTTFFCCLFDNCILVSYVFVNHICLFVLTILYCASYQPYHRLPMFSEYCQTICILNVYHCEPEWSFLSALLFNRNGLQCSLHFKKKLTMEKNAKHTVMWALIWQKRLNTFGNVIPEQHLDFDETPRYCACQQNNLEKQM